MDSIAKIAFGVDFDSLNNPKSEFSVAFDRMQELIVERGRTPVTLFRIKRYFGIGVEADVVRCSNVLNGLVQHLIQERQRVLLFLIHGFFIFFFCSHRGFGYITFPFYLCDNTIISFHYSDTRWIGRQ
jgi:hypothetical protein